MCDIFFFFFFFYFSSVFSLVSVFFFIIIIGCCWFSITMRYLYFLYNNGVIKLRTHEQTAKLPQLKTQSVRTKPLGDAFLTETQRIGQNCKIVTAKSKHTRPQHTAANSPWQQPVKPSGDLYVHRQL